MAQKLLLRMANIHLSHKLERNMSEFNIVFLDIPYNIHDPDKAKFEKYFINYKHDEWENGASFVFVDDLSIEYSLVISEDEKYGFNLIYSSKNINCYSLGNESLLDIFVENSHEMIMPQGTYIFVKDAWLATEDFLDNPYVPSSRIRWVTDDKIDWSKVGF